MGSPTTGPRMLTQTSGSHLRLPALRASRLSAGISLGGHPGTTWAAHKASRIVAPRCDRNWAAKSVTAPGYRGGSNRGPDRGRVEATENQGWPNYLLERAGAKPLTDCSIVAGSTPVVSFGHPLTPRVATLGINPSSGEFLARDKSLLDGPRRRLATLKSLGVESYDELDHSHASQIIQDCADYFDRRPYAWFNPLDQVLSSSLGVSYFDKTACHLDLVQWATDPVWQGLNEKQRTRLLAGDKEFLKTQVRHEGYRLIVVAGRTAMDWVSRAGLVRWRRVATLSQEPTATFFVGETSRPTFVGWSCNLQSQPGARRHIPELIDLLTARGQRALEESA